MIDYLDTAPCCFFSFNDQGNLLAVNQTLCSILGYEKNELKDQKLEMIFTIPTRIFYQTHFFPLIKMQGHAEEIFISLLAKNKGHLPLLMSAKRVVSGPDTINSCIGITVNHRKQFEDELLAAKHAAEKALIENTELVKAKEELMHRTEKLDEQILLVNRQNIELKQFNRVVTHDLQEPLRKLSIFSKMLERSSRDLQTDTGPLLQKLARVSSQMQTIVSGLQQYVWLIETEKRLTTVNLNTLLLIAEKKIKEELKEDLLEVHATALLPLTADADQLTLLFYEILSNAVQFRKPGGKANVSVTGIVIKQNRFRAVKEKYKYEDFLKLQITDQGIGFRAEYGEQVFELFKKLHNTNGRGLGLSLCKIITENHFGSIEADSKINEGTTITVLLPMMQ